MNAMEVQFKPGLQERLAQRAAQQGLGTDEVVQDVVERFFEEEDRFIQAVRRGEAALERGESLSHEEAGEKLARFL
jgi:predicted transcriptional regulator